MVCESPASDFQSLECSFQKRPLHSLLTISTGHPIHSLKKSPPNEHYLKETQNKLHGYSLIQVQKTCFQNKSPRRSRRAQQGWEASHLEGMIDHFPLLEFACLAKHSHVQRGQEACLMFPVASECPAEKHSSVRRHFSHQRLLWLFSEWLAMRLFTKLPGFGEKLKQTLLFLFTSRLLSGTKKRARHLPEGKRSRE